MGALLFIPLSWTALLLNGVNKYPWGYFYRAGPIHPFFMGYFVFFMILVFFNLIMGYKNEADGLEKNRKKYFLIALCIAYIGSVDYLPTYGIQVYPFGYLMLIGFVLIFAYAIIRYRLMDINVAIARAVIFTFVYALVLGIPFGMAGLMRERLYGTLGELWFWIPMISLLCLATSGPFAYLYLQRKAEDRLLKEQRRYQETLRRASKDMTLIKDLKHLLNLMVHILTKAIRINYAGIYLYDKKGKVFVLKAHKGSKFNVNMRSIDMSSAFIKYLQHVKNPIHIADLSVANSLKDIDDKNIDEVVKLAHSINATLVIPSFIENEMIGFLVLGNKISGQAYTNDDLTVLSVLANQSALAIENAQFYEEAKVAEVERIQSEKFATIGRLATSAKHEINNPLAMISMSLQSMGLALKDSSENFSKVRGRLKDALINLKSELAAIKKETLSADILSGMNAIELCFNDMAAMLDDKGTAASKLNTAIDQFCSTVKNKQSLIAGVCDSLTDDDEREKINNIVHYCELLSKNALKIKSMDEVLNGLIKSSADNVKRIEVQTQTMHDLPHSLDNDIRAIKVSELIEAAFGFARQQTYWENLGATPVEKNIPDNCPKIKGYFNRLVVVFLNLIINAYQAMTDAGLKSSYDRLIRISADLDPNDTSLVEIHFANKGPLIPGGVIERIFSRGYTTKNSGSGLGLHISRIQVELNKGMIYVRNIEGFGPDFIVKLPIWKEGE